MQLTWIISVEDDFVDNKGWCKNTKENTVKGEAIGEKPNIDKFAHWLTNIGSPKSVIEKCETSISDATEEHMKQFKSFKVIKDWGNIT